MPRGTIERLAGAGMAAVAPVAPAIVEHNLNFGQMPWGERGQNGPMAAGWQTETEKGQSHSSERNGSKRQSNADRLIQEQRGHEVSHAGQNNLRNIPGREYSRQHVMGNHSSSQFVEIPGVNDELLGERFGARQFRNAERVQMERVEAVVGGLAEVWSEHLPHGSVVQEMLDSLDYVNQSNVGDWLGGVVEEMMDNAERMVGELRLNSQEAKQLPKNLVSLNFAELPEELGLDRLHQQLTKSEVKATQKLVVELNEMLLRGETLTPDVAKGMVEPFSTESLPFVMPMLSLSLADTSRRRRNGAATVLLLSILLASCGGEITPEPGVTIVEPTQAAQSTEVQGGVVIVEPENTTEAVATIPSYAELVAEAMGGGFDPESLEPAKAAALEQLRQTFFIREYDTDGDQQLDGPILSELGENTVQWAVDGVTPYLAGEAINEVYGGGTDTALLVSGFRPGEPLVVSVAGANAELVNQGVPANGKYLVVMSPTQAVVTDERSNPVAEVGADGVWRVVEAVAVVTEVPTETPEPTAEPTPEPEVGMQNEQGQWWDGAGWQSLPEGEGWRVSVGEDGRVTAVDGSGLEHTWENGGWVQERTLASGLEAFANSGVTGQLEMVYSVHPEIVINEEPAKNFYNYFIEVVTTSKGFELYWQALGLYDQDSIMRYLEENNYQTPTLVGDQYWPVLRDVDSFIVNGQESDWVRGGRVLELIDLSKFGHILIDNNFITDVQIGKRIDEFFGQNKISYSGIGIGGAIRYDSQGYPIIIIKESEADPALAADVSLSGLELNHEYSDMLTMHMVTLVRILSSSKPLKTESNFCIVPAQLTSLARGACVPDDENGVHNNGVEYLGANEYTLKRLGLTGLFEIHGQ